MRASIDNSVVADSLERFRKVRNEDELKAEAGRCLSALGFDGFAYMWFQPSAQPDGTTNYREDWRLHYLEHGFLYSDPVISHARYKMSPFTWECSFAGGSTTKAQRNLFRQGRDFGITEGGSIPIHAPGGNFATLSVSVQTNGEAFHKMWKRNVHNLHLIGLNFHEAFSCRIRGNSYAPAYELTPRERECLVWTSRGKTAWEISEILCISSHTVESHLKAAMKKLGTFSKHHAVVKALLCGLIHP